MDNLIDMELIDYIGAERGTLRIFVNDLSNKGVVTIGDFLSKKADILNTKGIKRAFSEMYINLESKIYQDSNIGEIPVEMEIPQRVLPENLEIFKEIKVCDLARSGYIDHRLEVVFTNHSKSLADVFLMSNKEALNLDGFPPSRIQSLIRFQLDLENESEKYITYFNINFQTAQIPHQLDSSLSLLDIVYLCLKELSVILRQRGDNDYSTILEMYYGFKDGKIYDKNEVGIEVNKTEERIRQKLFKDGSFNLRKLFNGDTVDRFKINDNLIIEFRCILEKSMYNDSFIKLVCCDDNEIELIKLQRIAELFDCEIVSENDRHYLVRTGEILSFREHHRVFNQIIIKQIFPLSTNEIYYLMRAELNPNFRFSSKFIDQLFGIFCVIDTPNGQERQLSCKWEYLSSMSHKVKRIIFDVTPNSISRQDIILEYNKREIKCNIELTTEKQIVIKADKYFKCQANGIWYYLNDSQKKHAAIQSLKVLVDNFIVAKDGKVTLLEVENYLFDNGFRYERKSIRTTITKLCRISLLDNSLFIHNEFIDKYPEIELIPRQQKHIANTFIKEAIEYLKNCDGQKSTYDKFREDITRNTKIIGRTIKYKGGFDKILSVFIDFGILSDTIYSNIRYISYDEIELEKHDINVLGKRTEQEYKKNIRSLVINYLKEKDNFECPLTELRSEFIKFVKEDIKENAFYKIFNDVKYFERGGSGKNKTVRLNTSSLPVSKFYYEDVTNPEFEEIEGNLIITPSDLCNVKVQQVCFDTLTFDLIKLKAKMIKELKDNKEYNFTDDSIVLAIDDFYERLGGQNTRTWGVSIIKCLHDLWFKQHDYFDRETYIIKLAHGFETYLKLFHTNSNIITTGMYSVITLFPKILSLREYKDIYKSINVKEVDRQKKKFSYILSTLSYYGNKFRHEANNESLEMGYVKQVQTITDFIALYIYIGFLLKGENNSIEPKLLLIKKHQLSSKK